MTLWNLLIVVCFAVLYFGLGLVFGQLRRLRDEIRIHYSDREFPDPEAEPVDPLEEREPVPEQKPPPVVFPEETLQIVRQDLANVQSRILSAVNAIPSRLAPELEGLHRQLQADVESLYRQMQYLERNLTRVGRGGGGGGSSDGGGGDTASGEDRYSEARLLLANGVDEDRVIEKTGLTVEEVSLLRKLAMDPERA